MKSMNEPMSYQFYACDRHLESRTNGCLYCEIERLTRERDDFELRLGAHLAVDWQNQTLREELKRLRAALERISIGDSTDYPWAKNVASEALRPAEEKAHE